MSGLKSVVQNAAPYAIMLVLASYLFHSARGIDFPQSHQLGPAFWPEATLVLMMLACVCAILGHIRRSVWPRHNGRDPIGAANSVLAEERDSRLGAIANMYPWVGIFLTALYVYLFARIGYFLATSLFVTATIYLGNYRKLWIALLLGLITSIAFMFIFMRIVYVSLPIGTGVFADVSTFVMAALGIR